MISEPADGVPPAVAHDPPMHDDVREHHPLCTIELIAGDEASRCTAEQCAFWDRGCILARIETELEGRPEVARLLVDLRRSFEGATPAAA